METKCAIGWNIADKDYTVEMNHLLTASIAENNSQEAAFAVAGVRKKDFKWAAAMQHVHDDSLSADLRQNFEQFANTHSLIIPQVTT